MEVRPWPHYHEPLHSAYGNGVSKSTFHACVSQFRAQVIPAAAHLDQVQAHDGSVALEIKNTKYQK